MELKLYSVKFTCCGRKGVLQQHGEGWVLLSVETFTQLTSVILNLGVNMSMHST